MRVGAEHSQYKGPIKVFDMEGNFLYYLHGSLEIKEKGFNCGNVYAVINGILSHHKNHIFRREK